MKNKKKIGNKIIIRFKCKTEILSLKFRAAQNKCTFGENSVRHFTGSTKPKIFDFIK